jgi:uncharacterized small protein (DUF1192 family)
MSPLEARIAFVKSELDRFVAMHGEATDALMNGVYSDEIRRLSADLSRHVAMRTPETVEWMERERGLV